MFETLTIESTTTHSVVTAQIAGNPFRIRAIVGIADGHFLGASFVEVFRGNEVVPAYARYSPYGIEHGYTGEDADALTELCRSMTADLAERYGVTFREREEETEEAEETEEPEEEVPEGGGE